MLSKLKHSSITGMKSAWVDSTYLYILLEYALNGDLHNYLKTHGKSLSIHILLILILTMTSHLYIKTLFLNFMLFFRSTESWYGTILLCPNCQFFGLLEVLKCRPSWSKASKHSFEREPLDISDWLRNSKDSFLSKIVFSFLTLRYKLYFRSVKYKCYKWDFSY